MHNMQGMRKRENNFALESQELARQFRSCTELCSIDILQTIEYICIGTLLYTAVQ